MSSHLRVLTESDSAVPLDEIRTVLGPEFELVAEEGDEREWAQLLMRHADGAEIALLKRNRVAPGELGQEELNGLETQILWVRPNRTVEWLIHYFSHVRVVYSMESMSGVDVEDGWSAIARVQAYLWKKSGGILQADGEGFTNREGQHVLWQFEGPQNGDLDAAVMDDAGRWLPFTMDMADPKQVEAFRRGEVPKGSRRIP